MNFWLLIASIAFSWGLGTVSNYHLPIFNIQEQNGQEVVLLSQKVISPSQEKIPHKEDNLSLGVKMTAQSAAVMDKNTGIILWQKNAQTVRPIASISKLMTALVFLEYNPGWNETITMTREDETVGASNDLLRGEVVTVRDLFYLALISSDNNSAKALARSTGLSQEEFVVQMNKKSADFGLKNTKFAEVTGLNENNVSTALEVLELAKIAFANQEIKNALSRRTYDLKTLSGQERKIYSTNHLLGGYLDISAGKTGYIGAAGYCLVAEAQNKDKNTIISVVLGSAANEDRFRDLKVLTAWTFDNYSWR
ncbi:MAG: serine hydrolase [Patescibacteria group bacterium]|nr:serine hydrolase [Patescibacteria group bacterium]